MAWFILELFHGPQACLPHFGDPDEFPQDRPARHRIRGSRATSLGVLGMVQVRMCLHIGAGESGAGHSAPRRMTNGHGDALDFQIFTDGAEGSVWGGDIVPGHATPLRKDWEYPVTLLVGSGTIDIPMHARVPAQGGLAAGTFDNHFGVADTRIDYRYSEPVLLFPTPWPDSCTSGSRGGSISFPFTASATVADHCEITAATDLDFGNIPGLIHADRDQASTITLACTGRTVWNLGLDDGLHAAAGTRRMHRAGSGDFVRYELYRDQARSQRWGNTVDVDTLAGSGTGHQQAVSVHGRVPAGQSVPASQYSDVITVTVTY